MTSFKLRMVKDIIKSSEEHWLNYIMLGIDAIILSLILTSFCSVMIIERIPVDSLGIEINTTRFFLSAIFQGLSALVALILIVVIFFLETSDREIDRIENRIIEFIRNTIGHHFPVWNKRLESCIVGDSEIKFEKIYDEHSLKRLKRNHSWEFLYFSGAVKRHRLSSFVSSQDLNLISDEELRHRFSEVLDKYREYCKAKTIIKTEKDSATIDLYYNAKITIDSINKVTMGMKPRDPYLTFLMRYNCEEIKHIDSNQMLNQIIKGVKEYYIGQRRVAETINQDLNYFRLKRNCLKGRRENIKKNAIPPLTIITITILLSAILLLNIEWLSSNFRYHLFTQLGIIFLTIVGISWVIGLSIKNILMPEDINKAIKQQKFKEILDKKISFEKNIDKISQHQIKMKMAEIQQ